MLCLAGPASSSSAAVAGGLSTSVALAVPQRQRASVPRCSATHALPLLVLLVDHHTARHPSAARRPTVPPPMARASTAAAAAMSAWQPPSAAAPTTPRKLSLGTGGTTDILPSDLLWSASVSHGDLLGCVRSVLLAMHERHANIFELLAAINSFLQHGTTKAEHVVAWVRRPRRSHRSLRTPLPLPLAALSLCSHDWRARGQLENNVHYQVVPRIYELFTLFGMERSSVERYRSACTSSERYEYDFVLLLPLIAMIVPHCCCCQHNQRRPAMVSLSELLSLSLSLLALVMYIVAAFLGGELRRGGNERWP